LLLLLLLLLPPPLLPLLPREKEKETKPAPLGSPLRRCCRRRTSPWVRYRQHLLNSTAGVASPEVLCRRRNERLDQEVDAVMADEFGVFVGKEQFS
jgi:hypothetical protein